jgi:membrane protease YdiL (CAAX protease family)
MFKNLTDFSYKRDWKAAIGFYLAYFLLGLILGAIGGGLAGIQSGSTTFDQGYSQGVGVGAVIGVVYCLVIACLLLVKKKLYKNFGYILLGLLSGVLALFGGSLLGLIIPAIMTTKMSPSMEVTI